jgi:hypothetical protein
MRHHGYEYERRLFQTLSENTLPLAITSSITSMDDQPARGFDTIEAESQLIKVDQAENLLREGSTFRPYVQNVKQAMVIIESRVFLRECLQRSLQ